MDSYSESNLISLISQVMRSLDEDCTVPEWESKIISLIIQIVSLVRTMDLALQPKPESRLMSLITQTVTLFNSVDVGSLPKPLSKLILLLSQKISLDSDQKAESDLNLKSLVDKTLEVWQDPELISLISLIRQIVSVVIYLNSKLKNLISLCPQVGGYFSEGKFQKAREVKWTSDGTWNCFLGKWKKFSLTGEVATHFRCESCNGKYHKEYEMAPLQIKPHLHRKYYLQLVLKVDSKTRECYCCDEDLKEIFYYCSVCDYAMNIACVDKAIISHVDCPKWHEHQLALFPRHASLTCNVCALSDSISPIYMCPPCDFVVHLKCINLPRVIRISRHPHRICYKQSFDEGNLFCSVCRRKIDNYFGGYSCVKDGCLYAAHSRCATRRNVWDGLDLDGEPEEIEEEIAGPFVRISPGIIQHFHHEQHHLRLDEDMCRDYNDNKQCQACITQIYFGNFYSCVECEFVLHETCANLSRKIYHSIHPHLLILALVGENDYTEYNKNKCSVCYKGVVSGFFYECGKEECRFQLHVHCATISEPLVHGSHVHPLFLTSKPEEHRICWVCNGCSMSNETFNCIECNDFALCFLCAALPQKVKYKHDKHILSLCYGEETRTVVTYWCEACEKEIDPDWRFYRCIEYCCVTLHIKCLIGKDLYMKSGSSFLYAHRQVSVLSNSHHMSRPICSICENRCPQEIVLQCSGKLMCCLQCLHYFLFKKHLYIR